MCMCNSLILCRNAAGLRTSSGCFSGEMSLRSVQDTQTITEHTSSQDYTRVRLCVFVLTMWFIQKWVLLCLLINTYIDINMMVGSEWNLWTIWHAIYSASLFIINSPNIMHGAIYKAQYTDIIDDFELNYF